MDSQLCGTESFLNRFATFHCASIELEDSNQYVEKDQPIHNIKAMVVNRQQRLLVVAEKLFGARPRSDQKIVCKRRLKVILNPGIGDSSDYQVGWITYQPKCLKFYKVSLSSRPIRTRRLLSLKGE